jgi:hypothetical protein
MTHRSLAVFVVVSALVFAGLAHADTVCFDWDCSEGTNCTFNAGCSEADPFIWKYNFDFGDGTSTGLTGNPEWEHDYTISGPAYPYVTLYIYPWSEVGVLSVQCQIVVRNVYGPPLPQSGRCTSE